MRIRDGRLADRAKKLSADLRANIQAARELTAESDRWIAQSRKLVEETASRTVSERSLAGAASDGRFRF
jgi:hypothetical protein